MGSLEFYRQVKTGTLKPDEFRDTKMCMTQYGRIFATWRMPVPGKDVVYTSTTSKHIVVLCNNLFYNLTVLDSEDKTLPEEHLAGSLAWILNDASSKTSHSQSWKNTLGVLTGQHRDKWAQHRALLEDSELNRTSLRTVDTALLLLALDDRSPSTPQDRSDQYLHNHGNNRWYDKQTLIVTPDGDAGFNMEHSPLDGHTMIRMLAFMNKAAKSNKTKVSSEARRGTAYRLQWTINEKVAEAIKSARAYVTELCNSVRSEMVITKYGGGKLRGTERISSDALVQQAFQLSYRKLHDTARSTYESVQVKHFYHGRTECLRCVTKESVEATKAFCSKAASSEEKKGKLLKALVAHKNRLKDCKKGEGIDRHLLGLQMLAQAKATRLPGYLMPNLFLDPNYSEVMTSYLSTSNCSIDELDMFNFGPVTGTGLGLGYIIAKDFISISITSFIGEEKIFARLLKESLQEIYELFNGKPKL